jgi:hypothetical protein
VEAETAGTEPPVQGDCEVIDLFEADQTIRTIALYETDMKPLPRTDRLFRRRTWMPHGPTSVVTREEPKAMLDRRGQRYADQTDLNKASVPGGAANDPSDGTLSTR